MFTTIAGGIFLYMLFSSMSEKAAQFWIFVISGLLVLAYGWLYMGWFL